MREGGYVRYDGSKSRQILQDCEKLIREYGGSLRRLHEASKDPRDLERRLLEFYGVGPVTTQIFLRELRPFWKRADPQPVAPVIERARRARLPLSSRSRKSVAFARLEAQVIRELGHRGSRRRPSKTAS